jgi:hypothetical protein
VVKIPSFASPPVIVTPEIVDVAPGAMSKIRSFSLPSIVRAPWPGPVIVRSCVMSRSPIASLGVVPSAAPDIARLTGPATAVRSMTSSPGEPVPFAVWIARRSVHGASQTPSLGVGSVVSPAAPTTIV